jgi:signal transduction histidine kinase
VKPNSLRLRLLVLSLASIGIALALSGIGLVYLFERHVESRVDAELDTHLRQLAGNVAITADGIVLLSRPADPRFEQPLSGLYWQMDDLLSGATLRSRSLWDDVLALPADGTDGVRRYIVLGPASVTVIVRARTVMFPAPAGERHPVRIAVAVDATEIETASHAFAANLAPSLLLLGGVLALASWLQVRIGLRPLATIREEIGAIRSGRKRRLDAPLPLEVMPLAGEVNQLLDEQERTVARARAGAADLAHGLKTPLTVLGAEARRLRAGGDDKAADTIEDLADSMRRQVDRALARSRLHPGTRAASEIEPLVLRLIAVMRKTPQGERLAWNTKIGAGLYAAIDRDDLAELLGNLLDNAARWAQREVLVSGTAQDGRVVICVDDDGPGIPAAERLQMLERGVGNTTGGSGLGLAIASDIVEACGGTLRLQDAALGGLRVCIELPERDGETA